jgi:hypothetical protein
MRIQLLADSNEEQKICVIVPQVIKSSFLSPLFVLRNNWFMKKILRY